MICAALHGPVTNTSIRLQALYCLAGTVTHTLAVDYSCMTLVIFQIFALLCGAPSSPVHIIRVVMIVWSIRGKIIRTVPCCTVYHNCIRAPIDQPISRESLATPNLVGDRAAHTVCDHFQSLFTNAQRRHAATAWTQLAPPHLISVTLKLPQFEQLSMALVDSVSPRPLSLAHGQTASCSRPLQRTARWAVITVRV